MFEYVNGKWNKIPLPTNVINPRDIYYNDGTLYITGTAKDIWNKKDGVDFYNCAGGVYTYKDGEFTQIFDESISTTSVVFDSKGTMYLSDTDGNIYRKEQEKDYVKIYDSYHYRSESLQISEDDDRLYLASFGGGMLKIEGLNSLYDENFLIGDINRDGKVSLTDLVQLKLYIVGSKKLEGLSLKAADIDKNGKITITDLVKLNLMILK